MFITPQFDINNEFPIQTLCAKIDYSKRLRVQENAIEQGY